MTIGPIDGGLSVPGLAPELGLRAVGGSTERGFADVLRDVVAPVVEAQGKVDDELGRLLSGASQDVHAVQIAMQKAELTFQLALQVRNKMLQAYHEIMQMQI